MSESAKNTLVGHMCYRFANEVECMSQVRVNPETGEFDSSQAFKDMLDFSEGESDQPQSESLVIGNHRLAVVRLDDPSVAYFNEESKVWSSRPRAGFFQVQVDAESNHDNAMLLRVADIEAFKEAVTQVHSACRTEEFVMKPEEIKKITAALVEYDQSLHDADWMKPIVKTAITELGAPVVKVQDGLRQTLSDVFRDMKERSEELAADIPEAGARALMANEALGIVDSNPRDGWFDVEVYSTKDRFDGPNGPDGGLDGFNSLSAAKSHAQSKSTYPGAYEVQVVAYGDHAKYTPNQCIWSLLEGSTPAPVAQSGAVERPAQRPRP